MKKINLCLLANVFQAYTSCKNKILKDDNINHWSEMASNHEDRLNEMFELLPHGSGLDAGVKFNYDESTQDKLVFDFSFHHLNEWGSYEGWTEHRLTITPTFVFGFKLNISGKDRRRVKEYLYDLFNDVFEFDPNYQLSATSN